MRLPQLIPAWTQGRRRLARDAAWATSGQVAAAVCMLVATRVTSELVSPAEYGLFALLLGVITLGRSILVAPILQAVYHFNAEAERAGTSSALVRVTDRALLTRVGWLTALGFLGGATYSTLSTAPFIAILLLVLSVAFEVAVARDLVTFQATRRHAPVAVFGAVASWLRLAFVVASVAAIGRTATALAAATFLGAAATFLLLLVSVRRQGPLCGTANAAGALAESSAEERMAVEVQRYATPLMPLALFAWAVSLSDRYVVGGALGQTAAGMYVMVFGLAGQPFNMVQMVLAKFLSPVYNAAVAADDFRAAKRIFGYWMWTTVAVCGLGVILFWLLSDVIASLLLADEYRAGARLMPAIAAGWFFASITYVLEFRLHARKQSVLLLLTNGLVGVLAFAVPLALIQSHGLLGAALACPIYYGAGTIASFAAVGLSERRHARKRLAARRGAAMTVAADRA